MAATNKKAAGTLTRPQAAHNNIGPESLHPNDATAQRLRILARLRNGPATTIELRRNLDVMMPATRIFELRHAGHDILLHWTEAPTECGRTHRVGLYTLRSGASKSGKGTNPAPQSKSESEQAQVTP